MRFRIQISHTALHRYNNSGVCFLKFPKKKYHKNRCSYFLDAYVSASFEFTVELTHPSSESTTASILLAIGQVLGCLVTIQTGWLYAQYGSFWAIFNLALLMLLGSVITAFVPNKLRRQNAIKEADTKINVQYSNV